MALGTKRTTCVLCEGVLEPAEYCTTAPLLSAKGLIKQVKLFKRKCSCCKAEHHLSYATGGQRLGKGEQMPYQDCTDERYFAITKSCVWETSLLVDFEAQALNSHTGFITFIAEYVMYVIRLYSKNAYLAAPMATIPMLCAHRNHIYCAVTARCAEA